MTLVKNLCSFLDESPSPFHATMSIKKILENKGFKELSEEKSWSNITSGKYYIVREGSSIVALNYNDRTVEKSGLKMIGAHTDSPCFKVRCNADMKKAGYSQLNVTPYGGMLLAPWFDRDLSLAGLVFYKDKSGTISSELIKRDDPFLFIPNLAIHLNRSANENRTIHKENEVHPVLSDSEDMENFDEILKKELKGDVDKILSYDLSLFDTQKAKVIGIGNKFLLSARLDNLLSCYIATEALVSSESENTLVVCNDHEEVGSRSAIGADGFFLRDVLFRLLGSSEKLFNVLNKSFLISSDNAHALHPNYLDVHEVNHAPIINKGPVIKVNVNQRYATNAFSQAKIESLAQSESLSLQYFMNKSDMGCGSTIGPLTSSILGVPTIDIGAPTWAMHSIRESAGTEDCLSLLKLFKAFFTNV